MGDSTISAESRSTYGQHSPGSRSTRHAYNGSAHERLTVLDTHYGDRDLWTDADEEDCEGALEFLVNAFPHDAHVFRALELSQLSRIANVLNMPVESVFCAKRFGDAVPLAARTVESAIAQWLAGTILAGDGRDPGGEGGERRTLGAPVPEE